jgi:hypothetical protein
MTGILKKGLYGHFSYSRLYCFGHWRPLMFRDRLNDGKQVQEGKVQEEWVWR